MLSTNSGPWPIASSHQHQRNPYHALQNHRCYSALCTPRPSLTQSLLKVSHARDQLPFCCSAQALGSTRLLPALPCPVPGPPDRDTALTAQRRPRHVDMSRAVLDYYKSVTLYKRILFLADSGRGTPRCWQNPGARVHTPSRPQSGLDRRDTRCSFQCC